MTPSSWKTIRILPADLIPVGDFGCRPATGRRTVRCAGARAGVDQFESSAQDPDGHHVGVGIVVQTRLGGPDVAVVVLVGAHHAHDLVPVERGIEPGDAGPEAADLEDHLRPVVGHELDVAGHLVVLPDVVGDGHVDVALEMRRVGQPTTRQGVEVDDLCLLAPVAAALPGIHGAPEAGLVGGPAGLRQSPVPVQEQRSHQLRKVQVEIGEDEELVPEDVPPVGLAVKAPGRYPDVEVDGIAGCRLQQMEDVEVEGQASLLAITLDLEREALPQVVPLADVGVEELGEAALSAVPRARFGQRIADRAVSRGEQADDLLDGDRLEGL